MNNVLGSFFLISAFLISFSATYQGDGIDDIWPDEGLVSNSYPTLDPVFIALDETKISVWDENLTPDIESYVTSLSDPFNGCSGNTETFIKRRSGGFCVPPLDLDLDLDLPQSPFDAMAQKDRIDLEPVRLHVETAPIVTKIDESYCGSQRYVICDSGREQDEWPNGNGKYRLSYVGRFLPGSACINPHSIWCCEEYFPGWLLEDDEDVNGAQNGQAAWESFDLPSQLHGLTDLAKQEGNVADQCSYFLTLP